MTDKTDPSDFIDRDHAWAIHEEACKYERESFSPDVSHQDHVREAYVAGYGHGFECGRATLAAPPATQEPTKTMFYPPLPEPVAWVGDVSEGRELNMEEPSWGGVPMFAATQLLCYARAMLAAVPQEPIPMILYCPECGHQHVDAPEADDVFEATVLAVAGVVRPEKPWTCPPHRSHLCHGCGHIWRPADVATVGVESLQTKGKNDSPLWPYALRAGAPPVAPAAPPATLAQEPEPEGTPQSRRGELLNIAGMIECLKRECSMDPESPIAIQNARYMSVAAKVRELAANPLAAPVAASSLQEPRTNCPGIDERAAAWDEWHQEWNRTHSYAPATGDSFDAGYRLASRRAAPVAAPSAPAVPPAHAVLVEARDALLTCDGDPAGNHGPVQWFDEKAVDAAIASIERAFAEAKAETHPDGWKVLARTALPVVQEYARHNQRYEYNGTTQDPNGAHAWLEYFAAAQQPKDPNHD